MHHLYRSIVFGGILLFSTSGSFGQSIKTPNEILGYNLGEKFTYHHKVLEYFHHVDAKSDQVSVQPYGQTYEGRDLMVAYVSSAENLKKIDALRKQNIELANSQSSGTALPDVIVVWLSYNVHGNEANSTETSMKVLYELANGATAKYKSWLENMIIVIDPCLNPDGRERYVTWNNKVSNRTPNPSLNSREHHEEWASGRMNHYLFDLNRDWLWQTQDESTQRLSLYNSWLPQVHIDFHEQYYNDPYYFAPSAKPIHSLVSPWQIEFQKIIGTANTQYFNEKGWLYFTGEVFDLLYPGYGDTYPTFNGAIGMTYEMAGHSMAGLAIITDKGDTLKLSDRIDRHFTATMATLESSFLNRKKLLMEFQQFFMADKQDQSSYLLKSTTQDKLNLLADLLKKNDIRFQTPTTKATVKGLQFESNAQVTITAEPGDLIVPLNQPKSVLAKVLFERNTKLADTITYDITAWSLPFVYGVDAFLVQGKIPMGNFSLPPAQTITVGNKPYAWMVNWTSMKDAAFLAEAQKINLVANYSTVPFQFNGHHYSAGTLIFTRYDNEKRLVDYTEKLTALAAKHTRQLTPLSGGAEITDLPLGSSRIKWLKKPRIALLWGAELSSLNFGELWYYLERELDVQADIIQVEHLGHTTMQDYDVMIFPPGNYSSFQSEDGFKMIDLWVNNGGTLILMEEAISGFVGESKFNLKKIEEKKSESDSLPVLYSYKERERKSLKDYVQGSIYRVTLDNTHPLAYGYGNYYYTLKNTTTGYKYLIKGWNVGLVSSEKEKLAGFAGSATSEFTSESLVFGVEERGAGKVIYFVDNPVFRAFWQNGKLLLANAIYFNQ